MKTLKINKDIGIILLLSLFLLQSCSLDSSSRSNPDKKRGVAYYSLKTSDLEDIKRAKNYTGVDIVYDGEVMLAWDYNRKKVYPVLLREVDPRIRLEVASFGFDEQTGSVIECKVVFLVASKVNQSVDETVYRSSIMNLRAHDDVKTK